MGLPFGYTLKGKGVMPDDHPQNYGLIGQHGKTATNRAMENADFVLMIGCNGDDRAFLNPNNYTGGKTAIINPYTVNVLARFPVDYVVASDSFLALTELLKILHGNGQHEKLREWNSGIRRNYDGEDTYNVLQDGMSPVDLMRGIDAQFNPDILVLDVGEHQMHAAKLVGLKS